ncbi:MAG: cystathionine gamma-synthase [Acidimicrobiales bacterium]
MSSNWGFETKAIHVGQEPDEATGAVNVPIFQTSTYAQDGVGKDRGFEYSRTGNPTRDALETNLATLENASFGRAFASGMAAEDAILRTLRPGDHLILGNDAYGGTYRLITRVIAETGVSWSTVDLGQLDQVGDALRPETRIVWTETPTNPMLAVVDIGALAEIAHGGGAQLVVDNTFATPYLQRPLDLGADCVVHSTTKYAGGHSDVVGGFAATNHAELDEQLGFLQNAVGAVPGPMDCYLLLRGLKTLAVRMDRQCDNAEAIVAFLEAHSGVAQTVYPGLATNPGHAAAARQMKRFGAMVSFIVAAGAEAANELVARTEVFTLAESLGAVESLIEVPAAMTHLSVAGSDLAVDPALVRLSVGLESIDDLVGDLSNAFDAISGH